MKKKQVVLVGNPNSGKTTLFNALTGATQRVGNWPGVTVEKKAGSCRLSSRELEVIDLPGLYTLDSHYLEGLDEKIAAEYLLHHRPDLVINVVDATNLERHLYLTVQLLERGLPMVIVLTMTDRIKNSVIDQPVLAEKLGVPVLPVLAHQPASLGAFKQWLDTSDVQPAQTFLKLPYAPTIQKTLQLFMEELKPVLAGMDEVTLYHVALLALQGETHPLLKERGKDAISMSASSVADADLLIADARYEYVHQLCQLVRANKPLPTQTTVGRWLDKIFLNQAVGLPAFLVVMYTMFLFSIKFGGAFQPFFDGISDTFFVSGVAYLANAAHLPNAFTAILAYGVGKGINTVVTFIPVLACMYLFLAFLEGSGYMARAAFVVDRLMRAIGLPGKAFVPLIVGFGCNVPAVMATRTLENEKDRILVSLMAPFMSCSARLAIFTVFVSVFFPTSGHNIIFALYLIGVAVALLTAFLLRHCFLSKEVVPLVMELPPYHRPQLKVLLSQTWARLKHFLLRAGRVIVPVCAVLGTLNVLSLDNTALALDGHQHSILSQIGKFLTPVFMPMGITADNWPATVGLLMGTVAKEVVIATLNTLYSPVSLLMSDSSQSFHFWQNLYAAWLTIPDNLSQLVGCVSQPLSGSAPEQVLDSASQGELYRRFDGSVGAFAYLLFVLLYVPCISTMAALRKELNTFWMYFSLGWSTLMAYLVAVVFYQVATIQQHWFSSVVYLSLLGILLWATKRLVTLHVQKSNSLMKDLAQ